MFVFLIRPFEPLPSPCFSDTLPIAGLKLYFLFCQIKDPEDGVVKKEIFAILREIVPLQGMGMLISTRPFLLLPESSFPVPDITGISRLLSEGIYPRGAELV